MVELVFTFSLIWILSLGLIFNLLTNYSLYESVFNRPIEDILSAISLENKLSNILWVILTSTSTTLFLINLKMSSLILWHLTASILWSPNQLALLPQLQLWLTTYLQTILNLKWIVAFFTLIDLITSQFFKNYLQ